MSLLRNPVSAQARDSRKISLNQNPLISPTGSRVFSAVIFALPAFALTTAIGLGAVEAAVLATTLVYGRPLWSDRSELFGPARWIILAFALNLALAVMSTLSSHSGASFFENPSRQLVIVGAIGLAPLLKPKARWFWYGLFVGAIGVAGVAIYQRFGLNWERAGGFHQTIIFGDIAMAMGLTALASISYFRNSRLSLMPYVAFVAGLTASILSGTRGGWIVLILCIIPLWLYREHTLGRTLASMAAACAALVVSAYWLPVFGIAQRLAKASSDLQQFDLGNSQSSVGVRLEMWRAAWKIVVEHPLMGVGRANFNQALNDLIARGEINASVKFFYNAHNEMLHALATEGILGGVTLALVYGAPIVFFVRCLRRCDAAQSYALAGLLLVLSFIGFGATQVMFVHHIGSAFYSLMVCVLAGICIASQKSRET
jgi:O-antigen ligase